MLSAVPYLSLKAGLVESNLKYLLFQVQEKVRTVRNYQMGNLDNTDISDVLSPGPGFLCTARKQFQ